MTGNHRAITEAPIAAAVPWGFAWRPRGFWAGEGKNRVTGYRTPWSARKAYLGHVNSLHVKMMP